MQSNVGMTPVRNGFYEHLPTRLSEKGTAEIGSEKTYGEDTVPCDCPGCFPSPIS